MKKSKWTGTGGVFKFTYVQAMKSKAMIITMAIVCLLALLSFPVMTLLEGGDDSTEAIDIDNVYIYEENISMSATLIDMITSEDMYKETKFEVVDKTKMEDIKTNVLTKEDNCDVILSIICIDDIESDDFGIKYEIFYSEESSVKKSTVDEMVAYLSSESAYLNYVNVGIDKEMADLLSESVNYNIFSLDENGNIISDAITDAQYNINYALLMIVMLAIIFASSFVAGQIVTEKSSKIVEYLLTSVKPMAIITGKVFASVSVVLTILASFSICIVISGILNGVINMNGNGGFVLPTIISDLIDSEVMAGANPLTILLALAIIILGFVFYCFLGGVSGAMVSKIEELGEGTKLLNFAMIIGAYLALGLIMSSSLGGSGWGDLNYLVYFLPLSAPFIVPSYLLFGIISPAIGLAVVALNIVLTSGLVVFVSKVYEQLIYHNGNPLKIKDLFHLSKNKVKKND